jgi:hypothetical protein
LHRRPARLRARRDVRGCGIDLLARDAAPFDFDRCDIARGIDVRETLLASCASRNERNRVRVVPLAPRRWRLASAGNRSGDETSPADEA